MYIIAIIVAIAILNAVMDTLSHHYGVSVFKKLNAKFWDARTSAANVKWLPIIKYPLDAWHIFKSLFLCGVIGLATIAIETRFPWYIEFMGLGAIYILVFNTLYNVILKK